MAEEDELKTITGEESLGNFMELVQKLKDEPWTSRLNDILDSFEDFLTIRSHLSLGRTLMPPAVRNSIITKLYCLKISRIRTKMIWETSVACVESLRASLARWL